MNILKKEMRNVPAKLSQTQAQFLEYAARNPEVMKRENYPGLMLIDVLSQDIQPWPTFINRDVSNRFAEAAVGVCDLLRIIPERLFDSDVEKMSRYFEMPVEEVRYCFSGCTEEHLNNMLSRGDFMYTSDGLKCLELNVSGGLGGLSLDMLGNEALKLPVIDDFITQNKVTLRNHSIIGSLMQHICKNVMDRFSPKDEPVNIALLIPEYDKWKGNFTEIRAYSRQQCTEVLDREWSHLNLTQGVFFGDFEDLELKDDHLYFQGKRLHALIDGYHGNIPPEYTHAMQKGNLLVYNGAVSRILTQKLCLAVLSEHEDSEKLTPEEREKVKRFIPWTRKVVPGENSYQGHKIDMEDFLVVNKKNLILKRSSGYGGIDVSVGRHVTDLQWKGMVRKALRERIWVAQEYVQGMPFAYQRGDDGCGLHDVVWGFYVFGTQFCGTLFRVSAAGINETGVINVKQGAEVSPVFEVEE